MNTLTPHKFIHDHLSKGPSSEPGFITFGRMLKRRTRHFLCEEEAATTVEYALLVALIIVFSVSAVLNTGDAQDALWFNTADRLEETISQN